MKGMAYAKHRALSGASGHIHMLKIQTDIRDLATKRQAGPGDVHASRNLAPQHHSPTRDNFVNPHRLDVEMQRDARPCHSSLIH